VTFVLARQFARGAVVGGAYSTSATAPSSPMLMA
jgi:hypothetical protein